MFLVEDFRFKVRFQREIAENNAGEPSASLSPLMSDIYDERKHEIIAINFSEPFPVHTRRKEKVRSAPFNYHSFDKHVSNHCDICNTQFV